MGVGVGALAAVRAPALHAPGTVLAGVGVARGHAALHDAVRGCPDESLQVDHFLVEGEAADASHQAFESLEVVLGILDVAGGGGGGR